MCSQYLVRRPPGPCVLLFSHPYIGLWKWNISFCRGSMKGTEKYLAREGLANMFMGPEPVLDIFYCCV
jgi:hypothetical protein